jgi:hypothetical protein
MFRYRTVGQIEAEILALRAAAERAGLALACVFSSSDEYEADLIRERRAQGAYRSAPAGRPMRMTAVIAGLALAFLLI